MKVFLILAPVFALVGLWLLVYSRRRSRLVRAFGEVKGLSYRQKDDGTIEQGLDQAFALTAPFARRFSRIRDVVERDGIRLFRVTEALDLSRYGEPQNTASGHVAVFCDTVDEAELFFLATSAREFMPLIPKGSRESTLHPAFAKLKQIIEAHPPPHTLSVTIMRGKFLAYLEPLLVGSEKESDLDYLFDLAEKVRHTL